jgi:exopolysaccharide biosynthesis polyprenyl glycosylphosphotransferase
MSEGATSRPRPAGLPRPDVDDVVLRSDVMPRYRRFARWIAATDCLSLVAAMFIAYIARFGLGRVSVTLALSMAVAITLLIGVFCSFRLYSIQHMSPAEEFRRLIAALGVGAAIMALFSYWSQLPFSRLWLGLTWVLATVLCLVSRQRWHRLLGRMRADGRLAYRTLVVGGNDEAMTLLRAFRLPSLGFRPVGIVPTGGGTAGHRADPSIVRVAPEAVRDVDALRGVIDDLAVDCIFVASSAVTPDLMSQIAKASRLEGVMLRLSANLPYVLPTRLTVQPLRDLTVISLRSATLSGGQAAAKRAMDLLVGSAALILTVPLLLGIALAIQVSSGGPILFRQERVGRQGRPFTLLKFRTMVHGAEAMLIDLHHRNEADGPLFKIRDDPRVTRLGRWLRRWSLDELPQLFNVLKGDMSLVGPRPPLPREVQSYADWQHARLEVAPGVTGLWQVEGRSELSFDKSVRRDLFYIENWSLSFDLFILAKTVPALLSRRGAY